MTNKSGKMTGDALTISKQARKINALRETIDFLHDKITRLQASKKNKEGHIARLHSYLRQHGICCRCGSRRTCGCEPQD